MRKILRISRVREVFAKCTRNVRTCTREGTTRRRKQLDAEVLRKRRTYILRLITFKGSCYTSVSNNWHYIPEMRVSYLRSRRRTPLYVFANFHFNVASFSSFRVCNNVVIVAIRSLIRYHRQSKRGGHGRIRRTASLYFLDHLSAVYAKLFSEFNLSALIFVQSKFSR